MTTPPMRLVDSHAHLQAEAFGADVEAVLRAAGAAGVERVLVPGWDYESSQAAVALADGSAASAALAGRPAVQAAVGCHPHAAARADDATWARIERLAADPAVVAIGETGLDYDRGFSPRDAQLANLRRNLELAFATGKPAILHCRSALGSREAQDDLMATLREAGVGGAAWRDRFGPRPPAVLHSFSGPVGYAEAALAMGAAVSFSGLVFRRGEEASAEVARLVPPGRVLVETDSPYLSPPGAPRRRNEPAWVAIVAAWLARQRDEDPEPLGERLIANYGALFEGAPATR